MIPHLMVKSDNSLPYHDDDKQQHKILQCICFCLKEMCKKCACQNHGNHPPPGRNSAFISLWLLLQTLLSEFQTFVHPQKTQELERYAVEIVEISNKHPDEKAS